MIYKRPFHSRLLIAPAIFARHLSIGAGQIPLLIRLRVACHLTWLLLRPPSTNPRRSPASGSTR